MNGFRDIIARLWDTLDLGAPAFAADNAVELETDEVVVRLSPAVSGYEMVLSATAGHLASDPVERMTQTRQMLKSNLRHLTISSALVALGRGDMAETVFIRKNITYTSISISRIISLIEEFIVHYRHIKEIIYNKYNDKYDRYREISTLNESHKMNFIFRP